VFNRAGTEGKYLGAHPVPHADATWLADAGKDMRMLQKLLGHEDIRTTEQIYAAHSQGYLRPVVDLLGEVVSPAYPKIEGNVPRQITKKEPE
jgi:site-specific recombinase XerD